jgi:hypothetical protein
MKRLALLILLLLAPVCANAQKYVGPGKLTGPGKIVGHAPSAPPINFIGTTCGGSPDGGAFNTDDMDTTGANFIVIAVGDQTSPGSTVADNKSNGAPTGLTAHTAGSYGNRLYYYTVPTVGTGHHFTITPTSGSSYASACVMAFANIKTSSPADQQDGNDSSATSVSSIAAGATGITPSQDNELVIAAITLADANDVTIDGGFYTPMIRQNFVAGQHFLTGISYLIQTTATAANPTVSWTPTATPARTSIASFKGQ